MPEEQANDGELVVETTIDQTPSYQPPATTNINGEISEHQETDFVVSDANLRPFLVPAPTAVTRFRHNCGCGGGKWVCWCIWIWIFAMILPPVAVAMDRGFVGEFWLNIVLTLLGYFPGT